MVTGVLLLGGAGESMRVRAGVRVCVCGGCVLCLRVCSLTYSALYCLRPVRLHHIFPPNLINGTIFGTELLNKVCVF